MANWLKAPKVLRITWNAIHAIASQRAPVDPAEVRDKADRAHPDIQPREESHGHGTHVLRHGHTFGTASLGSVPPHGAVDLPQPLAVAFIRSRPAHLLLW